MAVVPPESVLHQADVVKVVQTVVKSGVTVPAATTVPVGSAAYVKAEYDALRAEVLALRAALVAAGVVA